MRRAYRADDAAVAEQLRLYRDRAMDVDGPEPSTPRRVARRDRAASACGLVSVGLWASAFVGIRAAGEHFAPGPLAAGRLVIGSVILGLIVAVRREPPPRRRDLPAITVCGLLWFALYNIALNAGERHVDAGTASMIIRVGPILIAVLAGVLLDEGFSPYVFAGGAVALAGTGLIAAAASDSTATSETGVLLCLLAACAYAGGVVTEKVVLRRVSPLQAVFCCCLVGAAACSPFLPTFVRETASAPAGDIAWLAYLGALPTAIGFTTWAYALAHTPAARLGALAYLGPPISIVLAWTLLDETPPTLALAGGATCLAGVALSHRQANTVRKSKTPPNPEPQTPR
jgi:drug/metabolite transporter (DMT)-like permease